MRKKGMIFIVVLGIVCLCAIGDTFAATIVTSDYWILENGYEANFDKGLTIEFNNSEGSLDFLDDGKLTGRQYREYGTGSATWGLTKPRK